MNSFVFSILVPAYNEEKNIEHLMNKLVKQKFSPYFKLNRIVVVACGCTDRTEDIVRKYMKKNKKIELMSRKKRMGKAAAINAFLKHTNDDITVMVSADVLPADDYTINNLLWPLVDKKVGMTASRPVPLNPESRLTNKVCGLIWHLHHKVAMSYPPKVGELVAFRNVVHRIPANTLADEERISAVIQAMGYKVVYVKDAVVYNRPPQSVSELITQRKRIFIGHLLIKEELGYNVPTLSLTRILRVLVEEISSNPKKLLTIIPLVALESFVRLSGFIDYKLKRYEPAWKVCETTKKLM